MSALNLFLLMTAGFLLMLWWDLRSARQKLLERTSQSQDPIDFESLQRNSPNIVFARSIPSDIVGVVLGASGTLLYAGVTSSFAMKAILGALPVLMICWAFFFVVRGPPLWLLRWLLK